jgi:hypothetical protein
VQSNNQQVHITWHTAPPSPAQLVAWRQLWARLLGHVDLRPETPQPQDPVGPRAASLATVGSGHNLLSEHTNDNIHDTLST